MRTGAWYGDQSLQLGLPAEWEITTHWPATPAPLTDAEIANLLENPVAQPSIRQLCVGKVRPLIIVDDLNRPTPASRVIPLVLRHMQDAGIAAEKVTILMATGTHGAPPSDGLAKKVGPEAASRCRLLIHDSRARVVFVGRTSFGTPVFVNPEVLASDLLVGIGGVYPNYTAGFGGGSKLALGVLARRTIRHLHYGHRSMSGVYNAQNTFRRDLDEIAGMIRLSTTITVHVDAERQIVRLRCGDHRRCYPEAADFSWTTFEAPPPGDADVVVANTYPEDLSLLFARMKGFAPLRRAKPTASRIAIACCAEGVGEHGLFPELVRTRSVQARDLFRRLGVMSVGEIAAKAANRITGKWQSRNGGRGNSANHSITENEPALSQNPIWLYITGTPSRPLPGNIPGVRLSRSWQEILTGVQSEQRDRQRLKAVVYPCAPIQCLAEGVGRRSESEAEKVAAQS